MKVITTFFVASEMEIFDDCTFEDLDKLDIAYRALKQPYEKLEITEIQLEEI